jgi:hypothetical protein
VQLIVVGLGVAVGLGLGVGVGVATTTGLGGVVGLSPQPEKLANATVASRNAVCLICSNNLL